MFTNRLAKAMSMFQIMVTLVSPITYRVESREIGGLKERIHTLEIATENPNINIENALSLDVLYGFEKTSSMARRNEAEFAVNGMFYNRDGLPFGIMIHDGQLVSTVDIGTPTVILREGGQASIESLTLDSAMRGSSETISLTGVNRDVPDGEWVLFDRSFGKTTRVWRMSMNYCLKDGKVEEIIRSEQPVSLEGYDRVLTHVTGDLRPTFQSGEVVLQETYYSNGMTDIEEAFQTGGWVVKDGKNAAKDFESFMGYTTSPSPRTLVGVTRDGRLVFKVVDGRWPGMSAGVSGYEAALLMMSAGCIQAAYLDGGASSTMVVGGEVVNRPSEDGDEREVAHAILVEVK